LRENSRLERMPVAATSWWQLGDELSGVSQMTYEDSIANLHADLDEYLVP
jgi:hypothetical protein